MISNYLAIFVISAAMTFLALYFIHVLMWGQDKFQPDLIDLNEYERHLSESIRSGFTPRPPWPIPESDWSEAEMTAMRANRQQAQEMYEQARQRFFI